VTWPSFLLPLALPSAAPADPPLPLAPPLLLRLRGDGWFCLRREGGPREERTESNPKFVREGKGTSWMDGWMDGWMN